MDLIETMEVLKRKSLSLEIGIPVIEAAGFPVPEGTIELQEAIDVVLSFINDEVLGHCHPYSSYERGTNENINRMIRRFFPKGTNFDTVTQKQVQHVQDWVNNYPRKILGSISSRQYIEQLQITAA